VTQTVFDISYVDNTGVHGIYFKDTLSIGGITIPSLQLGLGQETTISTGLLGLCYAAEESTTSAHNYPTIVDQMVSVKAINTPAYSLWLDDLAASMGTILFGGIDTDKYTGKLLSVPIVPNPDGVFRDFTVVLTAVGATGSDGSGLITSADYSLGVILDSGTSITYLPSNVVSVIYSLLEAAGAVFEGYYVSCDTAQITGTLDFQFQGPNGPVIKVPVSEYVSRVGSIYNGVDH
jgi:hypothetical protein